VYLPFASLDLVCSALGKLPGHYTQDAEGSVCTFAGNFRRAKILKRFNCQTGATLETISVNHIR